MKPIQFSYICKMIAINFNNLPTITDENCAWGSILWIENK